MRHIRLILIVGLVGVLLSASTVGTVSATQGDYIVDLECPDASDAALDRDIDFQEDYISCVSDYKEAEITASSGFQVLDNLRWGVNQVDSVGQTLQSSGLGLVDDTGASISGWANEKHQELDAKQQTMVESTALEERENTQ